MKKSILTILACLIAIFTFAQAPEKQAFAKQDTLIVLSMKDFKEFAEYINASVDSKETTKRLIAYLQQRGRIIPEQPADKPKTEVKSPPKK